MRYSRHTGDDARAAVFVDYENLYAQAAPRSSSHNHPDEYIAELLDEVRNQLTQEGLATTLIYAYADYGTGNDSGAFIQRSLCLQGAEPRFVPHTLQRNASEIQLCVDVMETLQQRPDIRTFVIVSGDRAFQPLVQHLKRCGCDARVMALNLDTPDNHARFVDGTFVADALGTLGGSSRRPSYARNGHQRQETRRPEPSPRENVTYEDVHDEAGLRTLEIIEEHFGQYDEVYLTPLLRKLSEELIGDEYDPKTIISDLESAGAVYLEKRRGYPYDYTVLLVDGKHPDVVRIRESFASTDDYDDEDGYDDDFADDEPAYDEADWDDAS